MSTDTSLGTGLLIYFFALYMKGSAMSRNSYSISVGKKRKKYGLFRFLLDLTLTALTGGLWLVWLIFRWLRSV